MAMARDLTRFATSVCLLFSVSCQPALDDLTGKAVEVMLGTEVVATVDERFVSFAVDTSQAVGGNFWAPNGFTEPVPPYDFSRKQLRTLAGALSPAILRIGGSEADMVFYDLSDTPRADAPSPYKFVFTRKMADDICDFASELNLDILFTLNAGPGPRDEAGKWTDGQARPLIQYMQSRDCPVIVWELGNEINGFQAIHGTDFRVTGEQYAEDMAVARRMVDDISPNIKLAGPSSAFWPFWGELAPVYPSFMAAGADSLDLITWHYYPQQSVRCPVQSQPGNPWTLLDPANLDEIQVWADEVESLRDDHAPDLDVWLGETGHAQCGGIQDLSDRYVTGFWWLDQLGLMARRGQPVVIRQTLSGGDYQLVDEATLSPRPDYWGSLLWRRLMGTRVLNASTDETLVRVYAHCARDVPGGLALAVINLADTALALDFGNFGKGERIRYALQAEALDSQQITLNGRVLDLDEGSLPPLEGVSAQTRDADASRAWFPGLSYGFFLLPQAGIEACGG